MDQQFEIIEVDEKHYPFVVRGVGSAKHYAREATRDQAERRKALLEWESRLPLGQRTSTLLVEVRAVLSKIETTLAQTERSAQHIGLNDEDKEILYDLQVAAGTISSWRRTGRPPKPPKELR